MRTSLLKKMLQVGKMTKKQYATKLESDVETDQKLKRVYKREGLSEMVKFVDFRLNIVSEELENLLFEIRIEAEAEEELAAKKQLEKQK